METIQNAAPPSEQLNIRLKTRDKQRLEEAARRSGKCLSEWARDLLLDSLHIAPGMRSILTWQIVTTEITRLTLVAAQNQQDLGNEDVMSEIQRQAFTNASAIFDRELGVDE